MTVKSYHQMTDVEAKEAISAVIRDSSSEDEVRRRLSDELGVTGIALTTHLPTDQTGREASAIVGGLGGLIMKNSAMAMFMAHGPSGATIS